MSCNHDDRKGKHERVYVCQVCGKKKKSSQEHLQCCGKEMTSQDKGTWNS